MDLFTIAKNQMIQMLASNDMSIEDFSIFADYLNKYLDLDKSKVRPHLVIIHGNMWEYFHELSNAAMDFLGYEYVGRMRQDTRESDETFIFDSQDIDYEILYRLKDSRNADYTKTMRF